MADTNSSAFGGFLGLDHVAATFEDSCEDRTTRGREARQEARRELDYEIGVNSEDLRDGVGLSQYSHAMARALIDRFIF